MMPKLAVRRIVHDPVRDLSPIRLMWKKDELSFRVNELLNQPWTGDPIDFYLFTCDPFHEFSLRYDASCEGKPYRKDEFVIIRMELSCSNLKSSSKCEAK